MKPFSHVKPLSMPVVEMLQAEYLENQDRLNTMKVSFDGYPTATRRDVCAIREYKVGITDLRPPFDGHSCIGITEWKPAAVHFPRTKSYSETLADYLMAGEIGKVVLARMWPGEVLNWHTDPYPLYSGFTRCHIPLFGEESFFESETGVQEFTVGNLYLMDTKPAHRAYAGGTGPRVNLIIDLLLNRSRYFQEETYQVHRYVIDDPTADVGRDWFQSLIDQYIPEDQRAATREWVRKLSTLILHAYQWSDGNRVHRTEVWNTEFSRAKFMEMVPELEALIDSRAQGRDIDVIPAYEVYDLVENYDSTGHSFTTRFDLK